MQYEDHKRALCAILLACVNYISKLSMRDSIVQFRNSLPDEIDVTIQRIRGIFKHGFE